MIFFNLVVAFKKCGNKIFKDESDEVEYNYESFITFEESAKSKIMKGFTEAINHRKLIVRENKEILDYLKETYKKEKIGAIKVLNRLIIRCDNCGIKIANKHQKYCQNCGSKVEIKI
ncbi:MAG: hypothetical protein ACFE85_06990 [Candidatus Hodarchaeota archaeon]